MDQRSGIQAGPHHRGHHDPDPASVAWFTVVLVIFVACLPLAARSQVINEQYWKRYHSMADSVVISRLGKRVFDKYVYSEEQVHHDLSDYIYLSGDSIMAWSDRHLVSTRPQYCYFEYEICLDKWEGGTTIRFALDPSGLLVVEEPSNGLLAVPAVQSTSAMNLKEFEQVALAQGFRWDRSDRYRSLAWREGENSDSLHTNAIYVLTLGRYVGEGFEEGTGCTYLYDIIEGIRFDAFTGQIITKGVFQEPSGIVCRATSL